MPPFYKRLHRKKDGRELFLYGLMPLEGPPLPEHAEPFRPAPHLPDGAASRAGGRPPHLPPELGSEPV